MRITTFFSAILLSALLACNGSELTAPTPVAPLPSPTTTVQVQPPRVDEPFRWGRGILLFAGARAQPEEIRALYARTQAAGIDTLQPCAEVQSWPNNEFLPRGVSAAPFDETSPAYMQTQRLLDTASTIPRAQVLLVAICNLKEDGTTPSQREKWVRTIARLASNYENVALKIANEWKHPNSTMTEGEVVNLLRAARAEGFTGELTTDDNAHPGDIQYNPRLRSLVTIADFHPWRNPDPSARDIRRFVEKNGLPIVFTETTAYNSGLYDNQCSGLRTCDRNQILKYRQAAEANGVHWFYHCIGCLGWPVTSIDWIPPQ